MFLTSSSLEHKGNLPLLFFFQIPRSFCTPVNDYAMPFHSVLVLRALCVWSFTQTEIHVPIQCQQILTGHFLPYFVSTYHCIVLYLADLSQLSSVNIYRMYSVV